MSDILKEIYIKQAQRQKAAGTESEKIASLNAAYAQAQKVKKQRQINDQRQKAGALQVRSIEQGTAAKGALQKATEEISLAQEQRDARYNLYMDLTSKGIYDPNAAAALGVSKKTYDRVLAKVQAAKAARSGGTSSGEGEGALTDDNSPAAVATSEAEKTARKMLGLAEGAVLTEEGQKMLDKTIAQIKEGKMRKEAETLAKEERTTPLTVEERAAKRRAMNDDVSGVGQRGLNSETSKKKQIAQIEQHQNVDTKTATMVYNLNTAVQKHGREKVLEGMLKYIGDDTDVPTAAQKIFGKVEEDKSPLDGRERAFLTLLHGSKEITEEGREGIEIVLHNDTVYKVKKYEEFLKNLSDKALSSQLEEPDEDYGLEKSQLIGLAYKEYWERNPDEYKEWLLTETGGQMDEESIQKRTDAAADIEAQIAEIDKELAELSDVDYTKFRKGNAEGNAEMSKNSRRRTELTTKREILQNVLTRYERGGTAETDQKYLEYSKREDWEEKSQKRGLGNSTKEDFDEYDTKVGGGYLVYFDTPLGEPDQYVSPLDQEEASKLKKPVINDPLGFYLNFTAGADRVFGGEENSKYSPTNYIAGTEWQSFVNKADAADWDRVTEKEKEVYYYILNTEGKEKAVEYLDGLTAALNYRTTQVHAESLKKASGWELAAMNVLSMPANLFGGTVATADNIIRTLQGKDINPYGSAYSMFNQANAVRSVTAQKIDEIAGGKSLGGFTWGDTYQSLLSGADSAIGAMVFGKSYSLLMGANAAAATAQDLYERGATRGQIMAGSITVGVIEILTEKMALDNLFKLTGTKTLFQWLKNVVKQALPEAGEEVVSEIGGTIADILNMKSNSEWARSVRENDGDIGKALLQQAQNVYKAGLSGFISGGALGGVYTGVEYSANRKLFKQEGDRVQSTGSAAYVLAGAKLLSMATDGKIANRLARQTKEISLGIGQKISTRKLGRLSMEVGAYGQIFGLVNNGKTLSEIRATLKNSDIVSAQEIGSIFAEIKKGFVKSLSEDAKAAYSKTASDPAKQAAWVKLYHDGMSGVVVESFANDVLSAEDARAAYEFGRQAAQSINEQAKTAPENGETSGSAVAFDVDSDELARRLTIAGRNGLEIEEVYDGEITDTMRAIYNEGKRGDGDTGTTTVTVHKGSGTLRDKTGGRYNPQLNIEQLRRFAKVTGIDVEIAHDGSVDGKAAFEVGAFKILVSESATMGDFMHEVLESMAALSAEDFNHVSKMLVRHFLDHNHTLEELDDGIAQKMVDYNTKSYPFARKEWVCDYAGRLLSSDDGLEAFLGWLDRHDESGRAKKSLAEFIKALWEKLKAMCRGDWIGTAEKRRTQKLTDELQGIIDGLENTRTKLASLENGQTVEVGGGEGDVRYAKELLEKVKKAPQSVSENEVRELLRCAKAKLFADRTYIPVRAHTPPILLSVIRKAEVGINGITDLKELSKLAEDKPAAFKVYKVRQAMENEETWDGGKNDRPHNLSEDNLIDIITAMGDPQYIIYEDAESRYVEVVRFKSDDEKVESFAVIELNNNIDYVYMNGYEGGAYNVIVTVYSPDEKDEVDDLISRGTILYDKKRNTSQRSSSGFSPSLLNDVPFENSVQQDAGIVKGEQRRFSKTATATAEETEAAKRTLPSADAQMIGKLTAEMDELARNSGKLPQGERVKRDIAVPRKVNGKKTMLWARTFFESGVGTPEMVDPVSAEVLAQGLSYKVVGDKAAISSAESALSADGYEAAIEKFIEAADLMEQGNGGFNLKSGKVTVAKGQLLLRAAAERKDYHNFKRLVVILSEIETLAGQVVQAASMLKKMGGEVKLFEVKRTVDRINRELSQGKYGKSGADMKISIEDTVDRYNRDLAGGRYGEKNTGRIIAVKPELIDQLIAAGNDGDAANKIVVEIYKDIAKQLPSSFADKWNTWRYLAMLFNPTTHFRNILSNAIFTLPLEIKNTLQWAIEAGIGIFRTETERSATVGWSKQAMEFAKQDALEMELSLKSGGKYNEQDIIDQYRNRFKSRWLKWIDGGSRFNSALLEKEDWWFLKGHYARALARYITANKLDADNMTVEQLTRARDHAMKQAQKATFRDASQFANAISAFSRAHPVANVLAESVMPFKKTPINILKRGMEYSPLGLISTLSHGSVQLARGKVSANEYIGQLAAGLTGSMIVYLGFILAKLGLLQGGLGRDDEDRENRAKDKLLRLEGTQEFSLVIGDHTYTLDWMAPASIPLFIGVELYDAFADNDKKLMDKVIDALLDGTDVIVNTSMLSGLEGFVDALKYDDNVVLGALGNTAVNYVSQGFPTLAGRITSTIDGKRRVNYIDKTSWVPEILQELGNKFFTKFWPWAKPVYYDEFGREDQNTNVFGRFLENFFSPGYYSKIKSGDLEEVMQEIYEATDEPTPIPTSAAKSFKVNGETRQLKAKEYETFSKNRGQIAYDIMKDTIKSDAFKKMDAESQAKVLKEAYTYANAIAKTKAVNCDLEDVITNATKWIAGAEEIKGKIPVADIIVYRQLISEDSLGSGKRMDAVQALRKAGMSEQNAFDYVGKIRSGYAGDTGGTDYAVSDIYLSLKNGGTSYEMIYKDLLEAYRERGKTEKEARSIIRTGLTRLFKADYLAASPSERKEIVAMLNKSGVYGTKSDVSDTIVDWYNESLENK